MITPSGEVVYIDFGQSLLRDLLFGKEGNDAYKHAYCAPERRDILMKWSVGADIYSLGGVFFYLATGSQPPDPIPNVYEVKDVITKRVKLANSRLNNESPGIVDVIARMLQHNENERIRSTDGILHDLAMFTPVKSKRHSVMVKSDLGDLIHNMTSLSLHGNSLFSQMASYYV